MGLVIMMFSACVTVWGADSSGAAVREEADWASDKPDPQVRQTFKRSCVENGEGFSPVVYMSSTSSSLFSSTVPPPCLCYMNVSTQSLQVTNTFNQSSGRVHRLVVKRGRDPNLEMLDGVAVLFAATNQLFVLHYSVDFSVLWDAQPQC